MSVVVNGRFLSRRPGGLQRTARSLLEALLAGGTPVSVCAPEPDPLATDVLRAPGGRAGGQLWEQVLLPRHAAGRHVLSLANTSPLAGRGTVLVHDLAPLVGPQWFVPSMRVYGRLVLAGARRAEQVLTVSSCVAAELVGHGIPAARVHVVPPAVDPLFTPAAPDQVQAVRRRLELGEEPFVVLPGWADPRKDAALAVAASAAVRRPHRLVLLGGTRRVFARLPDPHGPTVVVAGHVPDQDVRALLTGAAALLYPSRYEGFGLPPLEAAACGTPSLVSDLPVLRESTAGGAVYLPVGDVGAWSRALAATLDDPPPAPPAPRRTWAEAGAELAALLPA